VKGPLAPSEILAPFAHFFDYPKAPAALLIVERTIEMNRSILEGFNRRDLFRMSATGGLCAALAPTLLQATEPKVTVPPYNTLTVEEEIALGRKFAAAYEKEVQILKLPLVDSYLGGILSRLAAASQQPKWPFVVKVVNTGVINAQAIPGGIIYLNRGLLEWVENENEMVGAMAHEIGHVVARHTTNRLSRIFIARQLYEKVKANVLQNNEVISRIIESLGGPVLMLAELKYDRDAESEADLLGFYEMLRAGWNPRGLLLFFNRLQSVQRQQSAVDIMLSDHPATAERAKVMENELASVQITKPLREQSVEFQALKAALKVLPAPPAPKK
jgi:predicted Zn-dependent protease